MGYERAAEAEFAPLIRTWAHLWRVAGLETQVTVAFSQRLRRSLGRCAPAAGRVVLHPSLRDAEPSRLDEVLCHEVAHVAAYRLYGRAVRPHGPEWRQLVELAGYHAAVRAPGPARLQRHTPTRQATLSYEHRCPVCHSARLARRPVRRWRCAECVAAGLDGEMLVTRLAARRESA